MWFCLTFIAIAVSTIYSQEITLAKGFEDHAVKRRVVAGDTLVTVIARVNTDSKQTLESLGFNVQTTIPGPRGTIMTGELIEKDIANVLESPVVVSLELSRKVLPMLNESAQKVIAFVGRQASGTTGEGIIIGIIDTGIDLANPDFQHTDSSTRIISLWDQTLAGTGPYDFGYGVECTETDINLNSCAQVDVDGHGTHVAGIAAGNGNNNNETVDEDYIGMAPEADLVIVKTAFYQNDIINGIDYIARKAISQGKPWVVNLSLGTIWGTRDGTSEFEYAINSLQNQANNDGVVIVASGNSGYDSSNTEVIYNATHWNINKDHIRYSVNGTYEFTVENTNPWPYYVGGNRIDDFVNFLIFYPASSIYGIRVSTPNDAPVLLADGTWGPPLSYYLTSPIEGGTTFGVFTQDGGVYIDNNANDLFPNSGDNYVRILIADAEDPWNVWHDLVDGTWSIELASGSGGPWDLYVSINSYWLYREGARCYVLDVNNYNNSYNVWEPGNAPDVITVGSMNTKNSWTDINGLNQPSASGLFSSNGYVLNDKSFFTSEGPSRSEDTKPEMYAPGAWIASSRSWSASMASYWMEENQGGNYVYMQGTSMAAPHVT